MDVGDENENENDEDNGGDGGGMGIMTHDVVPSLALGCAVGDDNNDGGTGIMAHDVVPSLALGCAIGNDNEGDGGTGVMRHNVVPSLALSCTVGNDDDDTGGGGGSTGIMAHGVVPSLVLSCAVSNDNTGDGGTSVMGHDVVSGLALDYAVGNDDDDDGGSGGGTVIMAHGVVPGLALSCAVGNDNNGGDGTGIIAHDVVPDLALSCAVGDDSNNDDGGSGSAGLIAQDFVPSLALSCAVSNSNNNNDGSGGTEIIHPDVVPGLALGCAVNNDGSGVAGITGRGRHDGQESRPRGSSLVRWLRSAAFASFLAVTMTFSPFLSGEPLLAMDNGGSGGGPTKSSSSAAVQVPSTGALTSDPSSRPPLGGQDNRYWTLMRSDDVETVRPANDALLDFAVGTVNNLYYDNSGGARFDKRDLYGRWRALRAYATDGDAGLERLRRRDPNLDFFLRGTVSMPPEALSSREGAVKGLRWLMSTLDDPFSRYMTREELRDELEKRDDGFLGLGAVVEGPGKASAMLMGYMPEEDRGTPSSSSAVAAAASEEPHLRRDGWTRGGTSMSTFVASAPGSRDGRRQTAGRTAADSSPGGHRSIAASPAPLLSRTRASNLPVVTAVSPDSPAERAGVVVGDRVVAVGADRFLGMGRDEVETKLSRYRGAENYLGRPEFTIAKPVVRTVIALDSEDEKGEGGGDSKRGGGRPPPQRIIGYRTSRVRLTTTSLMPYRPYTPPYADATAIHAGDYDALMRVRASPKAPMPVSGGDSLVHYRMLTPDDSILNRGRMTDEEDGNSGGDGSARSGAGPVGYIRLTRFSRRATDGYVRAVDALESAGATSYVIDLRNNYGGVIQEAMLSASTLLRDPHSILCFTLNARGGFSPHDVEEYVVDRRYPGYLLSSESRWATMDQARRDDPQNLEAGEDGALYSWLPPSSYASLHEQRVKRGIHRPGELDGRRMGGTYGGPKSDRYELRSRRPLVLLVNEGTASSAEFFASALRDNGRAVALVGTRTYGKGLIQHTIPMPDGGGIRLTVAEYLTPALRHVTNVGGARYDPITGELVGVHVKRDSFRSE